ncbi:sodium/glucose cotransporter 4 [Aplysia californica]|uniref:Sodium/glucose cotransporter 4 n=1 Tax=Aplysia californica TaxID=6500 RepID=A0ABM0JJZ0_APLCA|nr:sodium/glucose cotransporter 4 [Aplysia californica]
MSHSKAGCVFGASLKMTSFVLFIIPGMISRIFFPDEIACAEPNQCEEICGNKAGCSNIAYPLLVLRKLPEGVRGVMLAALLAALMSSLTSIFNSISSMFTMDIWRRFRRRASQHELMLVGRLCVLVVVGLSVLWIPIMEQFKGGQLWNYLQTVSACVSPPWCWVFLMAVFWKRTTEAGAFWGLIISTGVGIVRMVLEFVYPGPPCGSLEVDNRPSVLTEVHFLHFAIIISAVSVISTVIISLMTEPRPPEKLRRVTWWTRLDDLDPEETDSEDDFGVDEDEVPDASHDENKKQRGVAYTMYKWMCGVSDTPRPKLSPEEKLAIKRKMTDIREKPSVQTMLAVVAIILATVCTFLLGFFH